MLTEFVVVDAFDWLLVVLTLSGESPAPKNCGKFTLNAEVWLVAVADATGNGTKARVENVLPIV